MIWHSSDKHDVLTHFGVDKESGLSPNRAELILSDINSEEKGNKPLKFVKSTLSQLGNIPTYFLLGSVILSVILSAVTEGRVDLTVIMAVVILLVFAVASTVKEIYLDRFQHNADEYKKYSATVIRGGETITTTADRVVPGDILVLNTGDLICADARLIEENLLRCDEYVLTREIVYVDKDSNFIGEDIAEIRERKNMVFAGCSVVSGQGVAIVTETGNETELARQKINQSYLYESKKSDIAQVCRYSGIIISIICALTFILNIIFGGNSGTQNFALTVVNSVVLCSSIFIACYPESLPAIVSAIKSIGMRKLQDVGTIVLMPSIIKKASKISVICADKGEVFTTDKMTVAKIFDGRRITEITDKPLDDTSSTLLKLSSLCFNPETPDPTDIALFDMFEKLSGIQRSDVENLYPTLAVIPFDSERRLITTVKMVNGKPFSIVKGAPEELVNKCIGIDAEAAVKVNEMLAQDALRVIAVGYKELDEVPAIPNTIDLETGLTFAGFIGFETELSQSVVKSVRSLEKAGIRTVMITGDNLATAKAIARRVGILHDNLKAISEEELAVMSDEELDKEITSYAVFARITPESRFRIVRALQHNNERVAITGMTMADAPSLRKATIGIALKSTASDVAKDAADIIVEDTSLQSIMMAIATCKNTYLSIKRILHYILSTNLAELLTVIIGLLIFRSPMLLAAQLLLVNLITDTFPALSIGMAPVDSVKITSDRSRIFTLKSSVKLAIEALVITVLSLIGYAIGNAHSPEIARTTVFAIIGFSQILHISACYSDSFIIGSGITKNSYILFTTLLSVVVMLLLLATPIGLLFGITALPVSSIMAIILFALIFMVCDELIKIGFKLYGKIKT